MPETYDRVLGPAVFQPFAVDMARRVAGFRPARVLETAAGTGRVTAELVRVLPRAEIIATDLNAAMVEYGTARVPGAHWQQADAQALPFPDHSFDLITCQFGVMFLPDKPAAFAEARRVLRPGGRLVFNAWGPIDTHDFGWAVVAAVRQIFPEDPPVFLETIPHGYADPDRVRADLTAGGLICEAAESVTLQGTADSTADVARGFCTGTPLRGEIEARGELDKTTAAVEALVGAALGPGPAVGDMTAHVFVAHAPAPY
jgi:SAM-dependent methyltransferase